MAYIGISAFICLIGIFVYVLVLCCIERDKCARLMRDIDNDRKSRMENK